MAVSIDSGAKHVPEALANTHAGRLLEAILTDPSLPRSAARQVPPRGARAANEQPVIAKRAAAGPEAIPAHGAAQVVWSPEDGDPGPSDGGPAPLAQAAQRPVEAAQPQEQSRSDRALVAASEDLEAAKAAAERRDRRLGIGLVGGAVALVALAILLALALPHGPRAASAPADAAPAVTATDDEVLVIDEPFVVNEADEEVTDLEPLVIDRRTAALSD